MKKTDIIAEIKRTAAENGGVPLGARRFTEETGIGIAAWRGKYWRTWSEAVTEAGFAPNLPAEAHTAGSLLEWIVKLTREQSRFPTYADLRLARQANDEFPAHHAFSKLGSLAARIELVRKYASEHPDYSDVLQYLPPPDDAEVTSGVTDSAGQDGSVYLVRLGKHYKIGSSFDVPRRHREIALALPETPEPIHVIRTDDPSGIEAYWHRRFAAKRTNGEWFALSREDVRTFKRRKFM